MRRLIQKGSRYHCRIISTASRQPVRIDNLEFRIPVRNLQANTMRIRK